MKNLFSKLEKASLESKIFMLTTITTITIILALGSLVTVQIRSKYIQSAKANTIQNVDIISKSVAKFIDGVEDDILRTIISDDMQNNLKKHYNKEQNYHITELYMSRFLHQTINTNSAILGCDILLNDHEILKTSQFHQKDIDELIENFKNDETYEAFKWYGPKELQLTNSVDKNVLIIEKKIISLSTSESLGTMYMYVDEGYLSEIFENPIYNETEFFILSDDNTILSSSAEDTTICSEYISDSDLVFINENNDFITRNYFQNESFSVLTITPMTALTKSLETIYKSVVIFCIISIIISLVIARVIASYISTPVKKLANTMDQIILGNREIRASDTKSSEINMLIKSFNELMDTNEDLINEVYQKQTSIRSYEFSLLQEQIKPHFLYNTLSTISSLVKLDMKDEAIKTISNLAKFFRLSLSNGNEIITIKDELQMIGKYIDIQNCRYQNLITLKIDINAQLLPNKIPKLTLQPLVENAIYHGIKPSNKNTLIYISIKEKNEDIVISVKDYGIGINPEKLLEINKNINIRNQNHFGLTCVNQRIKLLYGDKYGLTLSSDGESYTEARILLLNQSEV